MKVHFSTGKDDWQTPDDLYAALDAEFGFTLDPCASDATVAKCATYFTPQDDGLAQSWAGHRVFVNPPYSKLRAWVAKAAREAELGATVVMLIPSRTDTRAFHDHILGHAQLRFVRGRLKFGGAVNGAPIPSVVVVFGGDGACAIYPDGRLVTPEVVAQATQGRENTL
jgi:phage N-6-adenine-methyltransferase